MATSTNGDSHQARSTVGLLLIVGDIISNEQRDEILQHLEQALRHVDTEKFDDITDFFNDLIQTNEFHADSQYRQITTNTATGSLAGFLYSPSFHTVLNVLEDFFNACADVSIIFCGQQINTNGALVLSDAMLTCEHISRLFEEQNSFVVRELRLTLPFVSSQWKSFARDHLSKHLQKVQISDLLMEAYTPGTFGEIFYDNLSQGLNKDTVDFDIYSKLLAKDTSGTIAFDEPNLYVLYGQQGEASLFGVRGFVVLVNGGFSRIPSYWNLLRGLQSLDACILTHFDYDVLPGLQTVMHRKTIPSTDDGRLCKPDVGAVFINSIQRAKVALASESKVSSNSKLVVNLDESIDQFLSDVKQLKIDSIDLVRPAAVNKTASEPINLYKKIAYGSLDLHVLFPLASAAENEKILATVQKTAIHGRVPSSSVIPLHHWYSSCSLLVWTPSSKTNKDRPVRILYTGACPQTLVFDALARAPPLPSLHEHEQGQQQPGKTRVNQTTAAAPPLGLAVKHTPQKPKVAPSPSSVRPASVLQKKVPKSPTMVAPAKSDKSRSVPVAKKKPEPITTKPVRPISKDKKVPKSSGITLSNGPSPKNVLRKEPEIDKHLGHEQNEPEQKSATQDGHEPNVGVEQPDEQVLEMHHDEHQEREVPTDDEDKLDDHNEVLEQLNNDHQDQWQENIDDGVDDEDTNEQNDVSREIDDEGRKRSESPSQTNDDDRAFIESRHSSSIDEIKSQGDQHDSMREDSLDEPFDAQDPSVDEPKHVDNHDDDDDEEMEIIHHDMPASDKHLTSSTEEIHPQGLPIHHEIQSKKPVPLKKVNNGPNRVQRTTASTAKPKPASPSRLIFNVDVAYIPYHGNEQYVDSEFFRCVRARYYILNAVDVSRLTLQSFLEGKEQWGDKKHLPVTLVPTFDGDQLRQFFVTNKVRLAELNIHILPASTRCNVQYDEDGSPAQRLRFSSMHDEGDR